MTDFITVPNAADARYHLRYVTVSPDFKIEEALRGMRRCQETIMRMRDPIDWREVEAQRTYGEQWQAIAISWASR